MSERETCVFVWLTQNSLESFISYFYVDTLPYDLALIADFVIFYPNIRKMFEDKNHMLWKKMESNLTLQKYVTVYNFLNENLEDKNFCEKYGLCNNFTHIQNKNVFVICDF